MFDLRKELKGRAGFITVATAMIEGLKKQDKRKGFTVDMGDFGGVYPIEGTSESMCFGCAATCAIQEYFGLDFDVNNIERIKTRAAAVKVDGDVLRRFEGDVDMLRTGSTRVLSDFCRLSETDKEFVHRKFDKLLPLVNDNWKDRLPEYQSAINEIMITWGIVWECRDANKQEAS